MKNGRKLSPSCKRIFVILLLALRLFAMNASALGESLSEDQALPVNTTWWVGPDLPVILNVEIPSPGFIYFHVATPGDAASEAHLVYLGLADADSTGMNAQYLVRHATQLVIRIFEAGRHMVLIEAQDVRAPMSEVKFTASHWASNTEMVAKSDDEVDEIDIEVVSIRFPGSLGREGLCEANEKDDHGDRPLCSTPITFGAELRGEIDLLRNGDLDFFSFRLPVLETIEIEIFTEAWLRVGLYDETGNRLAHDESEWAGSPARIQKTLSPNRYFIRVESVAGISGTYQLRIRSGSNRK